MDYNIYIHDSTGGGFGGYSSPTQAWIGGEGNAETKPFYSDIQNMMNVALHPDQLISKGVGALAQAFPPLKAVLVIYQQLDGAFQTALDFQKLHTGDYRTGVAYQNFKNGVSWVFAPTDHLITGLKTILEQAIENSRKEQRRLLLGDSDINQYTGRGV